MMYLHILGGKTLGRQYALKTNLMDSKMNLPPDFKELTNQQNPTSKLGLQAK